MAPATVDNLAVIRILLRAGSNINCRDNDGATPMAKACCSGNSFAISALMDRDPDMLIRDYRGCNVLHYLFSNREAGERNSSRPALFIKLTRMGVNPCEVNMFGCSALHLIMHNKCMTAFLLNGDVQIQDERPIPWSTLVLTPDAVNAVCLTTAFRLYRRKIPTERFRTLLNLEAVGTCNPLCLAASRGQIQAMENILSMGSLIDFEGCPEGSALMAASSAGILESVIYLVRHGASISFQGHTDFRSAVKIAATSPRVLRWLLVDRFTDQKKLNQFCHESTFLSTGYKPWSGTQKAEMIISGRWERQPRESSRQYWARLSSMTEELRGKFLPPNKGKTTRRQSKLVPTESVKIAVGGYFVPYDASFGERVTRKSKWSELSFEVRECLERYCL
ncbi:ankyrin repeat protein [Colletotrichum nymphaeae SA-01]|uniref:Ankyrin repeat protein n=1 Tax=Colletotrichum nymphaeae SA-01 TaxID=1460502 RepID=A0A135U2I6_9PEZI|nr:ankyrin repeat protein [Colletotrichum nymphaeae SA-01]